MWLCICENDLNVFNCRINPSSISVLDIHDKDIRYIYIYIYNIVEKKEEKERGRMGKWVYTKDTACVCAVVTLCYF